MSVCIFLAADIPLQEVAPSKEYPIHIDIDKGTIDDGGADDNYYLFSFCNQTKYCLCILYICVSSISAKE